MGQIKNIKLHIVTDIKVISHGDSVMIYKTVFEGLGRCIRHGVYSSCFPQKKYMSNINHFFHPAHYKSLHTTNIQRKFDLNSVYLPVSCRLYLFKINIDNEFTPKDFITGAKEAVRYVSMKMSLGEMNELEDVLTSKGMLSCLSLFKRYHKKPDELKIEKISNTYIASFKVEYGEGDRKIAYMSVRYILNPSFNEILQDTMNMVEKEMKEGNNVDLQKLTSKMESKYSKYVPVLEYSFCRDYTEGVIDSHWLIDDMKYI